MSRPRGYTSVLLEQEEKDADLREQMACCALFTCLFIVLAFLLFFFLRVAQPVTQPGEASNVISAEIANCCAIQVVTFGRAGMQVFSNSRNSTSGGDLCQDPKSQFVLAQDGARIDDVAVGGQCLFALDAWNGRVEAFRVKLMVDSVEFQSVGVLSDVPIGPFSGIAASATTVVVSGGINGITVIDIDEECGMAPRAGVVDLEEAGNPNVEMSPSGKFVVLSTHFDGPDFGFQLANLFPANYSIYVRSVEPVSKVQEVPGAGFSPGAHRPSNFALRTAVVRESDTQVHVVAATGGGLTAVVFRIFSETVREGTSRVDPVTFANVTWTTTEPCVFEALPFSPVSIASSGNNIMVVGVEPPSWQAYVWPEGEPCPLPAQSGTLPLTQFDVDGEETDVYPIGVALSPSGTVVATLGAEPMIIECNETAANPFELFNQTTNTAIETTNTATETIATETIATETISSTESTSA